MSFLVGYLHSFARVLIFTKVDDDRHPGNKTLITAFWHIDLQGPPLSLSYYFIYKLSYCFKIRSTIIFCRYTYFTKDGLLNLISTFAPFYFFFFPSLFIYVWPSCACHWRHVKEYYLSNGLLISSKKPVPHWKFLVMWITRQPEGLNKSSQWMDRHLV